MNSTAFIQNPYSSTQTLSITDIKRRVEEGVLVLTHPLQRRSQQWSIEQKSNLIRCILETGNMPSAARMFPDLMKMEYRHRI